MTSTCDHGQTMQERCTECELEERVDELESALGGLYRATARLHQSPHDYRAQNAYNAAKSEAERVAPYLVWTGS